MSYLQEVAILIQKSKMPRSLSKTDEKFMISSQLRITRSFKQLAKGKIAQMLDNAFECFSLPRIAKVCRLPSSPSGVVFASKAIIKLSELKKYEAILDMARDNSQVLQALKPLVTRYNRRIQRILKQSKTVYRGMNIAEFEIMARNGGTLGLHHRTMRAAKNNFVSFSIDSSIAMLYARFKGRQGLFIEADVSDMCGSEYKAVCYGVRNDINITGGGRRIYRPYEEFDGDQSYMLLHECEVRLREKSKPVIKRVFVLGDKTADFKRRLEKAVACLEHTQKSGITIKYTDNQLPSWQN